MSSFNRACGISLILFLVAGALSAQVVHPLNGHQDFVALCILPFERTSGASNSIDLRSKVIQALGKSAAMDYLIYAPEGDELKDLYASGFNRRKDRTYVPSAEYWRKSSTRYLVFGSSYTSGNDIVADLFVYDTKNEKMLLNKKFRGPSAESTELGATISRAMEASLVEQPKNKNQIKENGTKK